MSPSILGSDYWSVSFTAPSIIVPGQLDPPQDVIRLRRDALQFHYTYGEPVIYKHRWTEEDVDAGLAQRCPYCRDVAFNQPRQNDPYCFGTGYLGGYDDGEIIFMTFGDATEDVFKLSENGILVRDKHPTCAGPWTPKFADGDLLIQAQFAADSFTVLSMHERYLMKQVTPVTLRGYRKKVQQIYANPVFATAAPEFLVTQNFQVDHMEHFHPLYRVPLKFNYGADPAVPALLPGQDPDEIAGGVTIEISATFDSTALVSGVQGGVTTTFGT